MPSSSRGATRRAARPSIKSRGRASIGVLPEWNLAHLYPSLDAPQVKRDLEKSENECFEFERAFKGRLAALAAGGCFACDFPGQIHVRRVGKVLQLRRANGDV